MTEITFRTMLMQRPEGSVIGNWWGSVDRWTLAAVLGLFAVGIVLGFAASPPLAEKNDLWTYHYVVRHLIFATMALSGIIQKIMMAEAIRIAATIHQNSVSRSMIATAAKTESRLKRIFIIAR